MSPSTTRTGDGIDTSPAPIVTHASHVSLERALEDVEIAIARPAHAPSWSSHVRQALDRVADALYRHVEETEHEGGLFEDVIDHAPRLTHEVDRLREEHASMHLQVARCIERTTRGEDPKEIRADTFELLARLARHCQKGSDLVYETYCVDFGALD